MARLVLAVALGVSAVALAGCPYSGGSECMIDSHCAADEVCGRDELCAAAGTVRAVTTTWTVRGVAPTTTNCASHPDLYISYIGRNYGDTIGYAPVPCHLGQFKIDKLPDRFREVELGIEGGSARVQAIGASNAVMIDLP